MALHLQGDFYGLDGTEYTVSVYVDGYAGAVADFLANSLEITWEGDDGDLHAPIMASTARVGVSINSSTVQNAFTQLKFAKEGDYILKIDREGELYWVGYIIPDNVTVQDAKYPYTFEIRATDAIGRLKDIDYTGTGTEWDGWQTMLQHIYNALSFMPFADFWDVGERYFSAHNNMFSLGQVQDTDISPISNTRVQHRAFKTIDREGAVKYKSVYFVLSEITRAFGCRFYLAAGRYRMEQITEYASEADDITIKSWDKAGTATADEVLDSWAGRVLDVDRSDVRLAGGADVTKFSGGVITYLPALKEVVSTYKHFSTRYVSPIVNRWTEGGAEVAEIDNIEAGGGDYRLYLSVYLQFFLTYSSTSSYSARPKFRAIITMTDGADTWYLKREAVYNFGVVSYLPAEWVETTAYYEFFAPSSIVLFPVVANQATFSGIISIESAPLPLDGDISISFEYVEMRGTEDVVPSGVITSYDWEMVLQSSDVRPSGIVDARAQATRYYAYNTEGNSEVYETELTIGDGPTPNTFGRLQVWDGSVWRGSGFWHDLGSEEGYTHAAYIAREILFPRQRPSEKLEGALIGVIPPNYILQRSGTRYVCMRVTIDLSEGTSDGVWVFISRVSELEDVPDTGVEFEVIDEPSQFTPIQPAPSAGTLTEAVDRMTLDANGAFWMQTGLVAAGGAVTTVNAQSREFVHPFFDGDQLVVINPGNGLAQPVTVNTTTETDKTISVESFTPIADFPIGSIIAPGDTFVLRLLTKLRRQTLTFNLLPYYLDVPAEAGATFDAFWRVPDWMDGYLIARIEANYYTAGSGDERQIGMYKNGSFLAAAIVTSGQTRAGVSLGTYNEVAAGDLFDWRVVSATAGSTYPKGLTVNIQIIATL